jgi:chromate reductase, NAD(P)H dehydrogenase (quinone)
MGSRALDLFAISGSLRGASSNTSALRALAALAPAGVTVEVYDGLGELPHFNPDLDREGDTPPPLVAALRDRIARADAVVLCSPEYAHGVPGSLKNALDWLVSSTEFPGKPVALLDISPISVHVRAALVETLTTMSARMIDDPRLTVPLPRNRLDAAAMCADAATATALGAALAAILETRSRR